MSISSFLTTWWNALLLFNTLAKCVILLLLFTSWILCSTLALIFIDQSGNLIRQLKLCICYFSACCVIQLLFKAWGEYFSMLLTSRSSHYSAPLLLADSVFMLSVCSILKFHDFFTASFQIWLPVKPITDLWLQFNCTVFIVTFKVTVLDFFLDSAAVTWKSLFRGLYYCLKTIFC